MINYKKGDLFNDNADAIVNTVNCVGVMGRGIALQFKKKFPDNFRLYEQKCKHGEMIPGKMFVFDTNSLINPKYIINFPTKRHWKGESRISDIESGLIDLASVITDYKIKSIAIPPLGCGLGGLNWADVKVRIESILGNLTEVDINVYEPIGSPKAEDMVRNVKVPKMTVGRAALIKLIDRYLGGLLDPFVTLLEIHKLLYFLQMAGEALHLDYIKQAYGPYARNLSHVLNAIEGHMLYGYADGGNNPQKTLELIPGAVEDSTKFLASQTDTLLRMNKVSRLVEGFETPFGLELLSTVHWVVGEGAKTLNEVVDKVYAWNRHKQRFSPRQIELAFNRLLDQEWLSLS